MKLLGSPVAGGLNNDCGTNFGVVTLPKSQCFPSLEFGRRKVKYGGYDLLFSDQITNICGTCYCEPTYVEWGCEIGQIDECPRTHVDTFRCTICAYGQVERIQYDGS